MTEPGFASRQHSVSQRVLQNRNDRWSRLSPPKPGRVEPNEPPVAYFLAGSALRAPAKRPPLEYEYVPRESQKHYVERLRQLRRGTALVVSPGWLGIEGEFDVRARLTFDSSATPVAGTELRPRGKGAGVANLDHYRARMQETVEAASANDPAHLRRRVAELEAKLRRSGAKPEERAADPVEVEVPVLTAGDRARLDGIVDEFHRRIGEVQAVVDDLAKEVRGIGDRVPARRVGPPAAVPRPAPPSRPDPGARRGTPAPSDNGAVTLKKGARRIVEVLARHYPMKVSRRQVATLAGLKASGGTFQTYWSAIVRAGLAVLVLLCTSLYSW